MFNYRPLPVTLVLTKLAPSGQKMLPVRVPRAPGAMASPVTQDASSENSWVTVPLPLA